MTPRTAHLRQESLDARPSLTAERADLLTDFYLANEGKHSVPVMRARSFHYLCQHKTIYLGDEELIVGERGPRPKHVPTYPGADLPQPGRPPHPQFPAQDQLRAYRRSACTIYEEKIIPYWRGRSMRDKLFAALATEWKEAYDAGLFTEFMEQRSPGHTVLDDKIYRKGLLDFKREIAAAIAALDFLGDPQAFARREQLLAMDISCDAVILFAQRHAELARQRAAAAGDPARKAELEKIAAVCTHVPAHAPRDFHEALQAYWFCHLAVITELNGWDSFCPGHLDQHLLPFYRQGLEAGTLTPRTGPRVAGGILHQVQQPSRAAQGGRDGRGERHLHRLRQHQHRRPAGRWLRRFQRTLPPLAGDHRRDAPAAAQQQPAALAEDARGLFEACPARDPQGLRVPLDLQYRQCRAGTDSPGQDAGRRPRRRLQRLRGNGGLRQGGLHPHRLLQSA